MPDSSLCRAAAPRLRLAPPIASASAAAGCLRISCCSLVRLHPFQLLLPVCICFQLLLPDCAHFSCCCMLAACVRFSCCSRSSPLRLLLPDCVRFDCCSPIACIRLQPQLNVLEHFSRSLRFIKVRRSRVTTVQSRPTNIPLPSLTDRHTLKS